MEHVKLFKKMATFLMTFVMISGSVNVSAATTYQKGSRTYNYSGSAYTVYYNSQKVSTKKKTGVLIDGSVMIPYKACLVNKGPKMQAKYNKSSKKLVLSYAGTKVKMFVGKKKMKVNGTKKKISVAPLFVKYNGKNTLVVPARALFEEGFGFDYKYKKKKKAVYIAEPEPTTNSAPAPQAPSVSGGLTTASFSGMSTSQFIAAMGPIAQQNYRESGVLASVTLAQAILESGWGCSERACGWVPDKDGEVIVNGVHYPYKKGVAYYNFYGIGAVDSNALAGGRALAVKEGWTTPELAVRGAAEWISGNYLRRSSGAQDTVYLMKWDVVGAEKTGSAWHEYCTGLDSWCNSIARLMDGCYKSAGRPFGDKLSFCVPVYAN